MRTRSLTYLFLFVLFASHTISHCYGQLPFSGSASYNGLKFIENKGQWSNNISFRCDIPEGRIAIYPQGFGMLLYNQEAYSYLLDKNHDGHISDNDSLKMQYVTFNFVKPATSKTIAPTLNGMYPFGERRNYFLGNNSEHWATDVPAYRVVHYQSIYPNIDFRLQESHGTLKHEFIVSPKGNPNKIQLSIEGADAMYLNNENLHIITSVTHLVEKKPYAYQVIEKDTIVVECRFNLLGNILTYDLGNYDHTHPLVIDPLFIFATYSGSTADNWGNTACFDQDGNLFTGGTVFEFNSGTNGGQRGSFPTSPGAFQVNFQGGHTDIGLLKLDSAGTRLIYATYVGGNDTEVPTSLVYDEQRRELVVLATTGSNNFPIDPDVAYDASFNGGNEIAPVGGYTYFRGTDIVVFKLNENGSRMTASSYIGGSNNDGIMSESNILVDNYGDQLRGDINIDADGNIYVASTTSSSSNFPLVNAAQTSYGGGFTDGCIFKMNANLSQLLWSTYAGGRSADALYSIQLNSLSDLYVAGGTRSNNLNMTGLHREVNGQNDGIVLKYQKDSSQYLQNAGTYIGTAKRDQVYFLQIDEDDDIYLFGQTTGIYPVSDNVYANKYAGQFIHKLNASLDSTIYSTVFGSDNDSNNIEPNISPTAFLVSSCESILISGWGGNINNRSGYTNNQYTYDMPITGDAFQSTTDGSDFYFALFTANFEEFAYGTYFGGPRTNEHVDGGTSRFDKSGIVYQSVCAGCDAESQDFLYYAPQPDRNPGTYPQPNRSNNCNNGVIKFDLASIIANTESFENCINITHTFENNSIGGSEFFWVFGDGTDTIHVLDNRDITHTFPSVGHYLVTLIAVNPTTCKYSDTTMETATVTNILFSETFRDTLCNGESKLLDQLNAYEQDLSYSWSPPIHLNDPNILNPLFLGSDSSITYTITYIDTLLCETDYLYEITIPQFDINFDYEIKGNCESINPHGKNNPTVIFSNASTIVPGSIPIHWQWDFGNGIQQFDEVPPPIDYFTNGATYTITLNAAVEECNASESIEITLFDIHFPNVITPNEDTKNEYFVIEGIENTGPWKLEIYNRWSQLLYTNDRYDNSWNAEGLNPGVYYFLITSPDGNECKNWLTVVR